MIILQEEAWDPGSISHLSHNNKNVHVFLKYHGESFTYNYDTRAKATLEYRHAVALFHSYLETH